MKNLASYLKPYTKQSVLGAAFKLLEAVFELLLPLLMSVLIDRGVVRQDTGFVLRVGLLMLLIALIGAASAFTCQYFASVASQGYGTLLRNALLEKINTLSPLQLEGFGPAALTSRISADINNLQLGVAMLIRLVIRAPFLFLGGAVMAFVIHPGMALILVVMLPLFAVSLYFIMRAGISAYRRVQSRLDTLSLRVRENLTGVRVVRAFGRTEYEKDKFHRANADHGNTAVKAGKLTALLNPVTSVIVNLGIAALLWFGGFQVNAGSLSPGEVIAFINYIAMILSALMVLANLVIVYTRAASSAGRVNELLALEPEVTAPLEAQTFDKTSPVVSFENVSFRYGSAADYALRELSFSIKQGEKIGILGGTGSGKSTLLQLLLRFFDPQEGKIYLHGSDIRTMPLAQLRGLLGYVPQKSTLFEGTVGENLRLGKPDATLEELKNAARIAQAAAFIDEKPEKYDAPVSWGGTNLSGGQRQRLSIARGLVKQAPVLLLDDATSALDYATEAAFRKELFAAFPHTTMLLVTQRISSVRGADRILMLKNDSIAGFGTHSELLETCPAYRELYFSQSEEAAK